MINLQNLPKFAVVFLAAMLLLPQGGAVAKTSKTKKTTPIVRTETGYDATALKIANPDPNALTIRFLGTGAGGSVKPDKNGDIRRHSSILIEHNIVIDMTESSLDMIPSDVHPEVLIYSHSHRDHYDPEAALKLGVKYIFLGKEWAEGAKQDFDKAYRKLSDEGVANIAMPTIFPFGLNETICFTEEDGAKITVKALLGNHATSRCEELAHIHLIVKENSDGATSRLLYATDTSGITGSAARGAGIDKHLKKRTPINGLIMEATMGADYEEDFRYFNHTSTALLARTVRVLQSTECLVPKDDNPVYLTHLSKSLHPVQRELDATLPEPLKGAYDGLEVKYKL